MNAQGGRGPGMNWEVGTNIYTLLCIKEITNESLWYSMGEERYSLFVGHILSKPEKCITIYIRCRHLLCYTSVSHLFTYTGYLE